MNTQLKILRSELNLTLKQLADALNLTSGTISLIENGKRNLTDRTIADLERIYRVNPEWLRTGEGEMFKERTREVEIAEMTSNMFHADNTDYRYNLMRILNQIPDENMEMLYLLAKDWVNNVLTAENEKANSKE
jgi:transcriptional regulator with XRE-family HTH domain